MVQMLKPKLLQTLSVTFAAFIFASLSGCKSGNGSVTFETSPVFRGDMVEHVTASGSLGAVTSVDVGSQVSGKISGLYADFNSTVKKGQLVAEIDPSLYDAALRQAEGELASAQAGVILKRANLERKKILAPQRAASQFDLDQATADLAQSEASVSINAAMVDSARANLDYCKITAPVDGIVISRKVDRGQTLIAAMNTPVLFTIAQDLSRMNIDASVSEADIGQVKEGQSVDFGVDAFPDEVFHGRVVQIRKSPTVTQNVVTYDTMITVDNPGDKLLPGMTADVSILVAERKNTLKVSNAALRYTPPEGTPFEASPPAKLEGDQRLVYTLGSNGGKLRPLILKSGITDGVDTEIVAGISEGTPVITSDSSSSAQSGGLPPPPPEHP